MGYLILLKFLSKNFWIWEEGYTYITRKFDCALKTHNIFAAEQKDRLCWMPGDVEMEEKCDVAYFVGCTAAYRMQKVALATVRVLNALNIPFTMLGEEEWCCVSVLIRTGQLGLVEEFVNHNIEALKEK
jgi:heterodisulfide reductase subunit D